MKTRIVALVLTAALCTGCLSPEERKEFREMGDRATAQLTHLWQEYNELVEAGKQLAKDLSDGNISSESFTIMMAEINDSKETTMKAIELAQAEKDKAEGALKGKDWTDYLDALIQIAIGAALGGGGATVGSRKRRGVSIITGKKK